MAAVQEYLMSYKTKPQKCVDNALGLLKQYERDVNIPIFEWLWRLNLPQYLNTFLSKKISFANDMKLWMKDEEIDQDIISFRND